MQEPNFKLVNWGPDEAKGDNNLRDYFVELPEFNDVLNGTRRYIIGRKGTGKTSILERIRLMADECSTMFTQTLSLRNFPISTVRDLRDKSYRDKSQFVQTWRFLIINSLVEMVLQDQGAHPSEALAKLRRYRIDSGLISSTGFTDTIIHLSNNESKLSIGKGLLNGSKTKSDSTSRIESVHYTRITDALTELLRGVQTSSIFYLLLDELDEGFRAGDQNLRLVLLALLRAVEDVVLDLRTTTQCYRPILVLRSDIFDRLEDNDLNKLDDHILRLNWVLAVDGRYTLRDVVNARISASQETNTAADPWSLVTEAEPVELSSGTTDLWSYMASRTMERPRDIVKFLKLCSKHSPEEAKRLSFEITKRAESDYSHWLYQELKDEIHGHLAVWRESLDSITRIGKGKFKRSQLEGELALDKSISAWLAENKVGPAEIVSLLFDFGVLGHVRNRRWIFKYKDTDLADDPSADLIVHYGLHRKLRLRGPGGFR